MKDISVEGSIYQIAYLLHRHYLFGWTLTHWFVVALLVFPLLIVLNILPWSWPGFATVSLLVLGILIILWKIKRQGYLRFKIKHNLSYPQFRTKSPGKRVDHSQRTTDHAITPEPLPFSEMIPVHASGNFAVSGMNRYFVEERAYYQAFETRERVIMVNVPLTRLLLLSHSPELEVGWWYSFFTPQTLQEVDVGVIYFGLKPRPALRLIYHPKEVKVPKTVYLSFDHDEYHNQILADLCADQKINT